MALWVPAQVVAPGARRLLKAKILGKTTCRDDQSGYILLIDQQRLNHGKPKVTVDGDLIKSVIERKLKYNLTSKLIITITIDNSTIQDQRT